MGGGRNVPGKALFLALSQGFMDEGNPREGFALRGDCNLLMAALQPV